MKILLFSGTTEGRVLSERLNENKIETICCVATEYGREVMPLMEHVHVLEGRLDENEIAELIRSEMPDKVIDATHPYADVVTANVKAACEKTDCSYIRLLREKSDISNEGLIWVNDNVEAIKLLNETSGNILLTTGLKELPIYCEGLTDTSRIFARVLPNAEVDEIKDTYGLKDDQIIFAKGPFCKESNLRLLENTDAAFLVTKESGQVGGFPQKVEAARECGASCIVIKRPADAGYSFEDVCRMLGIEG